MNAEFRAGQLAYRAGLRSKIDDKNPYTDHRAMSWTRGHRDRWLHGIRYERMIDGDGSLPTFVAYVVAAAALFVLFIALMCAQP